ncbi:MAG: tyrosine-protein phosphatase [Tepidisphaeraceae bacterium]
MTGRIDIHCHLLPGVDDGCTTLDESLACARMFVATGYTHCFCTPHIWPNLDNSVQTIPARVARLQTTLNEAGIPLRVLAGGEVSLGPHALDIAPEQIVTYAMNRKFVLIDFWADKLPAFFEPTVARWKSFGLTVTLAHPERMRAIQDDPALADAIVDMGVLLQGNFQCFSDPRGSSTRRTAEKFLAERKYFALATDLHGVGTIQSRLRGLENVQKLVTPEALQTLLRKNPATLLPESEL